jgi:adenylate cyclase
MVTASMQGVSVAVASPLMDPDGDVVGALYGERRLRGDLLYPPEITPLDAILVETMARGVSAGRARVEHERMAVESRMRFEQFFTPELSRHLTTDPDLLVCKDTEVTLLFCDIRLFSSIGERMGPAQTMEWLSDVMGTMAERASKYQGVLVDFIGDELMLMWGAPSDQPEHATLACRAALDMARAVRDLDDKWRSKIGERTELGFGINTGVARVGNVGFERKFRYAPLGNTVNLASRVQGATKYLGAEVVVTEATHAKFKMDCLTRRLCAVRVVNIGKPVELYQLCTDDSREMRILCEQYEEALRKFEESDFANTAHILSEVLRVHPQDRPSLLLLSRAVDQMVHGHESFDGVFELPGK